MDSHVRSEPLADLPRPPNRLARTMNRLSAPSSAPAPVLRRTDGSTSAAVAVSGTA